MYNPLRNRFRQDLIVSQATDKETLANSYLIKDPKSGETFEFGEEEYFLCQLMDGMTAPSQISQKFQRRFGLSITETDFYQFSQQIAEYGLLESVHENGYSAEAVSVANAKTTLRIEDEDPDNSFNLTGSIPEKTTRLSQEPRKIQSNQKTFIWKVAKPSNLFSTLAAIAKPVKGLFALCVWLLIPGVPLAALTFFENQTLFWQDLLDSVNPLPFLLGYLFNLLLINFTARLAQGINFTLNGGRVETFGMVLAAGVVPRFYVDVEKVWKLARQPQLWCLATPLLARLVCFVGGLLIWYWTRSTETQLATWALLLAHSAFLAFVVIGCPLLPLDGYKFIVAYFRWPRNFLGRTYKVWQMVLTRRPLPKSLSGVEKWALLLYAPVSLVMLLGLTVAIASSFATGLASNFPGIFGRATVAILIVTIFSLAFRKPLVKLWQKRHREKPAELDTLVEEYPVKRRESNIANTAKYWLQKIIKLGVIIGLGILLSLPYPYRSGGQIQLLRPTQQEIQAQVDGTIIKVMFEGGDGKWIEAGTAIAIMEAADVENDVLTTQERIKNQQAILARERAALNQLLNTPRPEAVEVARRQVTVARQEVEVARQEIEVARQEVEVVRSRLDAAISQAEFSFNKANRNKLLYEEGAISLQDWEDEQRRADSDRIAVEELRQSLIVAQKDVDSARNQLIKQQEDLAEQQANLELVLSGHHPDEIEAARKEVEAAKAQLLRFQQELKHAQGQLRRTELLMPLDGRLITPYLPQQVGRYMEKGDRFAVAEDARTIQGEIRIPEYNVGEFSVGSQVEIKLLAYPGQPLFGTVTAIEPTAANESISSATERFIRVIVDISNRDELLKAGMTGYAKIEGSPKPLIVAFTRPIIRFLQVEVWSWLP